MFLGTGPLTLEIVTFSIVWLATGILLEPKDSGLILANRCQPAPVPVKSSTVTENDDLSLSVEPVSCPLYEKSGEATTTERAAGVGVVKIGVTSVEVGEGRLVIGVAGIAGVKLGTGETVVVIAGSGSGLALAVVKGGVGPDVVGTTMVGFWLLLVIVGITVGLGVIPGLIVAGRLVIVGVVPALEVVVTLADAVGTGLFVTVAVTGAVATGLLVTETVTLAVGVGLLVTVGDTTGLTVAVTVVVVLGIGLTVTPGVEVDAVIVGPELAVTPGVEVDAVNVAPGVVDITVTVGVEAGLRVAVAELTKVGVITGLVGVTGSV